MFKHEHSGPLKCIQCGYLTYNRRKFISHVESLGDVHDNKCTQCNEVMNTFDEHILHLHQVSCFSQIIFREIEFSLVKINFTKYLK